MKMNKKFKIRKLEAKINHGHKSGIWYSNIANTSKFAIYT